LEIKLHPLVVMTIADHHAREKVQNKRDRVFGVLFGQQVGRVVSIYESLEISFELDLKASPPSAKGHPNLEADMKLFKECYPTYECLGWYSTGTRIDPHDTLLHAFMMTLNERPLYLIMDPSVGEDARELPIHIFTEEIHVVGDKTTKEFTKAPYKIAADEAERVTVVHCAKVVTDDDKSASSVTPHWTTLHKAVSMLAVRIRVLLQFLKDHKEGKVKADQRVLREIKALVNRLPTMSSDDFKTDFLYEYNDALLITYLTALTKGSSQINEVMDKFNLTHASSRRGGMMGMMGPMGMMGMGPMMGMGMGMGFGPMAMYM